MKKILILSFVFLFLGFNLASAQTYTRTPDTLEIATSGPDVDTADVTFNISWDNEQELIDYCTNNVSVVIDDVDYSLNTFWGIGLDSNQIQSWPFSELSVSHTETLWQGDYYLLNLECSYIDLADSSEYWEQAQELEQNGGDAIFSVVLGQEPTTPIASGLFFGRDETTGSSSANSLVASVGSATGSTFGNLGPILAIVGGIILAFILLRYIISLVNETNRNKNKFK